MSRRFLASFLVLTFTLTLAWTAPVAALRSAQPQEQERSGLEELQAQLLSPNPSSQAHLDQPQAKSTKTPSVLAGLEEPTLKHFQLDPVKLSLKKSRVFLPLRGPGHTKEGDPEAVFTVDDLLVVAKTIRTLNDRNVQDPHLLIASVDKKMLDEFKRLTQGMELRYVPVAFDAKNGQLLDWENSMLFPMGNLAPIFVEPFSRLAGFRVSKEMIKTVARHTTPSDRVPLVVGVHGFTDFVEILLPEGAKAQALDLYHEWRWAGAPQFAMDRRNALMGFFYDTPMLELAEKVQSEDRNTRWSQAKSAWNELGRPTPLPGVPDDAYRIFYEPQPRKVLAQQSPEDLGRLIRLAEEALEKQSGDANRIVLFVSYLPRDHANWIEWHRSQGHRFEDLSENFNSFQGNGNSRVTVVSLPALPLLTQRRLMAATDLSVVSNEHTLADALFFAYRMPETAPLVLYAGINPGRLATVAGPFSVVGPTAVGSRRLDWDKAEKALVRGEKFDEVRLSARRTEGVETFRDLVAFEEMLNNRNTDGEKGRLKALIENPATRKRYLTELGQVILSNGEEEMGVDGGTVKTTRAGDPTLVNGLNVLARIIQRFDAGQTQVQILRKSGSYGAYAAYRDPKVPLADFNPAAAAAVDAIWDPFVQRHRQELTAAEGILYRYSQGLPPDSAGSRDLYDALDPVTRRAILAFQKELPPLDKIRQIVNTHRLRDGQGALAKLLGGGGSFRAFRLPGTGAALKYRYIHYAPHGGRMMGYDFEIQERYTTIRNTIRASARMGSFAAPQRVYVAQDVVHRLTESAKSNPKMERYEMELKRYIAMGLVEVIEEPLEVRIELKRRGLDDLDMPLELRVAHLDTFVVQREVVPLNSHIAGLLAEGRTRAAEHWLGRFFSLTHQLWRHGILVFDLALSAVGVAGEKLQVFDAGALPPLAVDVRLPDVNWNDYPKQVPAEMDKDTGNPVDKGFLREKIEGKKAGVIDGELGKIFGRSQKYRSALEGNYWQRVEKEKALTLDTFIKLWGQTRTDLEQKQLQIVLSHLPEVAQNEEIVREHLGGLEEAVKKRLVAARELKARVPRGVDGLARVEVDLQMHTLHSDGYGTPTAVVYEAYRKGLKAIAITDHYTLTGIPEAMEAGKIFGVEVIPGVELDTELDGLEFLGYFPKITEPDQMREFLKSDLLDPIRRMQLSHLKRAQQLLRKFNELLPDLEATEQDLGKYSRSGPLLHGNVYSVFRDKAGKDAREVLKERGIFWRPSQILPEGWDRKPEAVLRVLQQAGAVTVMAHPAEVMLRQGWDADVLRSNLDGWVSKSLIQGMEISAQSNVAVPGLDEVFPNIVRKIRQAHPDKPFIGTVGSDSHGDFSPTRVLGFGYVDEIHPQGNLIPMRGTYAVVEALRSATGLEESPMPELLPLRSAADFSDLGGTAAPFLQLAAEAFLEQEGVLEAIEVGGGVLSLGAEAATRLLGQPAVGAILIRDSAFPPRVGLPATPGPSRIILADKDIPTRANWPWVKVGDWPELRQAMPFADPRDFVFVEKEPSVTREVVASVLSAAFRQGGSAQALLGTVEEYEALPDNALDLLGREGQPRVVVLRVEMELKARSGETYRLILMA